jgi:hypothetical protein
MELTCALVLRSPKDSGLVLVVTSHETLSTSLFASF